VSIQTSTLPTDGRFGEYGTPKLRHGPTWTITLDDPKAIQLIGSPIFVMNSHSQGCFHPLRFSSFPA
jgi:hypothetical protein